MNEDRTRIRANQGHSIEVDLELKAVTPPELLYHGTVERFVSSIKENGLQAGSRQHVHLSVDRKTATSVGQRRGVPIILSVKSGSMHQDGFEFFLSANGVWLTLEVPARYLDFPDV